MRPIFTKLETSYQVLKQVFGPMHKTCQKSKEKKEFPTGVVGLDPKEKIHPNIYYCSQTVHGQINIEIRLCGL